jgi:hypothetical protein
MTPKEKALQLCDAFYQFLPLEHNVITTEGDLSWEYNGWDNAKQCALVAVDEIIEAKPTAEFIGSNRSYDNVPYWMEVKQEIEKL